jgi:hypothetical protein
LTLSLVDPMPFEVALSFIPTRLAQDAFGFRYPVKEAVFRRLFRCLLAFRLLAFGPKVYQIAHMASG